MAEGTTMAGDKKRKTWLTIIGTSVVVVVGAVVMLVAGAAYIIARHSSATFVAADAADAEFAALHEQFAGQRPFIELRGADGGIEPVVRRDPSLRRRAIVTLHVVSYDERSHKLVHADVPGWLLRAMSAHGVIRLANLEMFGDERDRITLADLERHGPGLVAERGGRVRVVVWTE